MSAHNLVRPDDVIQNGRRDLGKSHSASSDIVSIHSVIKDLSK